MKYIFRICLERTQKIKSEKGGTKEYLREFLSHSRSNLILYRSLIIYIYNGLLLCIFQNYQLKSNFKKF